MTQKYTHAGVFATDGDVPTFNAEIVMKDYDVDMSSHKATNIKNSNIEEMDLVLCATSSHKNTVLQMYPSLKGKVYTMKEYVQEESKEDIDIKDPWGYEIEIYRFCAGEIDTVLEKLIQKIVNVQKCEL